MAKYDVGVTKCPRCGKGNPDPHLPGPRKGDRLAVMDPGLAIVDQRGDPLSRVQVIFCDWCKRSFGVYDSEFQLPTDLEDHRDDPPSLDDPSSMTGIPKEGS
jgi:hypothetical protein